MSFAPPGLQGIVRFRPTDKAVGYFPMSLRDKDTTVGDLREIVALIEQKGDVEV